VRRRLTFDERLVEPRVHDEHSLVSSEAHLDGGDILVLELLTNLLHDGLRVVAAAVGEVIGASLDVFHENEVLVLESMNADRRTHTLALASQLLQLLSVFEGAHHVQDTFSIVQKVK